VEREHIRRAVDIITNLTGTVAKSVLRAKRESKSVADTCPMV
jgi:hypothetical protein